jgi:hypothetical protein
MVADAGLLQRSHSHLRRLAMTWWFVCPIFAVVIARLVADRACGNSNNLLPQLAAEPGWAWLLAIVYVVGHAWFVGGYLITVDAAGTLAPGMAAIRSLWGRHTVKLLLMAAVLLAEYLPLTLWRAIGAGIGCP